MVNITNKINLHKISIIKIIGCILLLVIMLSIYPFSIIPLGQVKYIPNGDYEWKQIDNITFHAGDQLIQEYSPVHDEIVLEIDTIMYDIVTDATARLQIEVTDVDGNKIGETQIELCNISKNEKCIFPLDAQKMKMGKLYKISFHIEGNATVSFYTVEHKRVNYLGNTYYNNYLLEGNLVTGISAVRYSSKDISCYVWLLGITIILSLTLPWKIIGYSYRRAFWIVIGIIFIFTISYYQLLYNKIAEILVLKKLYMSFLIISLLVIFFQVIILYRKTERKVEKFFLISALGWGLIYLLLMPPFSYNDELTHYAQANAYVNQFMNQEIGNEDGYIYIRNEDLIEDIAFPNKNSLVDYYENIGKKEIKKEYGIFEKVNGRGLSRASFLCYIPFGIGIGLSRLLSLNYVWSYTLSNLFGLIFYSVIIWYSIHILPIGKRILYLIAQVPLALCMATAFTYDMINFALFTLFFSLFCKVIGSKSEMRWSTVFLFILLGIVCFPIKYAYFPLGLLIFLIPKEKIPYKHSFSIKLVIIAIFILFIVKDNILASHFSNHAISETENVIEDSTELTSIQSLYQKPKDRYFCTVDEIIEDRTNIINYTFNTLYVDLSYYITGLIGEVMGWGDNFIPRYVTHGWWLLIILSIFSSDKEIFTIDKRMKQGILCVIVLCVGAVYMAMLLFCTPIGSKYCPSVNARYLLPMLFPTCLIIRNTKYTFSNRISDEFFLWSTDFLQICGIIYIFAGYIER